MSIIDKIRFILLIEKEPKSTHKIAYSSIDVIILWLATMAYIGFMALFALHTYYHFGILGLSIEIYVACILYFMTLHIIFDR